MYNILIQSTIMYKLNKNLWQYLMWIPANFLRFWKFDLIQKQQLEKTSKQQVLGVWRISLCFWMLCFYIYQIIRGGEIPMQGKVLLQKYEPDIMSVWFLCVFSCGLYGFLSLCKKKKYDTICRIIISFKVNMQVI